MYSEALHGILFRSDDDYVLCDETRGWIPAAEVEEIETDYGPTHMTTSGPAFGTYTETHLRPGQPLPA